MHGRRVLIIVQNLSVPFDRRVWLEACSLRDAGFQVSVVCPMGAGDKRAGGARRDPDPALSAATGHARPRDATCTSSRTAGCERRASCSVRTAPRDSTSSRRATRRTRSGRSRCRSSSPAGSSSSTSTTSAPRCTSRDSRTARAPCSAASASSSGPRTPLPIT